MMLPILKGPGVVIPLIFPKVKPNLPKRNPQGSPVPPLPSRCISRFFGLPPLYSVQVVTRSGAGKLTETLVRVTEPVSWAALWGSPLDCHNFLWLGKRVGHQEFAHQVIQAT